LLVAGCGGPAPKVLEPKAAPTATITVPVPKMPAQAHEDTPEGAAAFVKHYIDVFNYASNTGDVAELSRLSDPKCAGCQGYIRLYRDTYKAGGYFKGSDWVLGDVDLEFGGVETYVDSHVKATVGRYKDSSGAEEKLGNSEDTDIAFAVALKGPGWKITQLGLGKAE